VLDHHAYAVRVENAHGGSSVAHASADPLPDLETALVEAVDIRLRRVQVLGGVRHHGLVRSLQPLPLFVAQARPDEDATGQQPQHAGRGASRLQGQTHRTGIFYRCSKAAFSASSFWNRSSFHLSRLRSAPCTKGERAISLMTPRFMTESGNGSGR